MVAAIPEDALFLVDRGGTNYHGKGSDLNDRMVAGDIVLVERNDERFKATYGGGSTWPTIQDTDLVLAWDDEKSRSVSGANFKALFDVGCPSAAGIGVELPSPMIQYNTYDVEFTNMPAGAEYMDFYKTCYTATIIEEGGAFFSIRPVYGGDKLQVIYNRSKPPLTAPFTIDVEFTNNEDPSDVVRVTSNVFRIQA